ncbi:MAG: dihydrolipoyl dehydrogenase [Deltaproteobacteria bacterium]|nr:MAG: dihydrolipoyl dehydrogenase [Deltaproteobacteria bacterium]
MSTTHYQAIVIGAGPGGYPCAIRLGQLGIKTLVIEKQYWGGVCLNVGCIPSKALITAGKRLHEIQSAEAMGLHVGGEVTVDMKAMQAWKTSITDKLSGGVQTLLKGNKVDMVGGTAELTGKGQVTVTDPDGGTQIYTADHIVLATGSSPIEIPGFRFADGPILDSTKALDLSEVPEHLIVIGGGYIGLEMGSMYRKLGAEVTVIEMQDQVLPGFDPDVVKVVARKLKKSGVTVHLKAKALGWEATDQGVALDIETAKGKDRIEGDKILVTVGRRPNSKGLGLEALDVAFDGPFVKVDKQFKTNVPGLYAIGDLIGNPMLAHKATHEGEVLAEVIAGHNVQYDARTVPAVVFTDPEIASAGLDEPTAKAQGEIKVGKVPYAAVGRALTTGETDGFYKVILDAKTHRVLGITIVGSHASDLISEAALAIELDAEALDIGLTIHPHPTLGEGLMEAAKAALGEAIHVLNR